MSCSVHRAMAMALEDESQRSLANASGLWARIWRGRHPRFFVMVATRGHVPSAVKSPEVFFVFRFLALT